MSDAILIADGKPLRLVAGPVVGEGPWARLLATAIVPDARSGRAQRGREFAEQGNVHSVTVSPGKVAGKVAGSGGFDYEVELHARPLPPRVWSAAVESGRDFTAAAAGREQSLRLEHELAAGWGEPLVPKGGAVRRSCTCPDIDFSGTCKHAIALAYALAGAIDDDPSLLLHWRGVTPRTGAAPETVSPVSTPAGAAAADDDPWVGGEVPVIGPPRPLPVAAVLKRLGPSGIKLDGVELTELLEPAYVALARSSARS